MRLSPGGRLDAAVAQLALLPPREHRGSSGHALPPRAHMLPGVDSALTLSTALPAASHEAHLNRMVSLGVVPPMLARLTGAVDQVSRQEGGRGRGRALRGRACCRAVSPCWRVKHALQAAPRLRHACIPVCLPRRRQHSSGQSSLPAGSPCWRRCRCCRTSRRGARCSSRSCARWATLRRAAAPRRRPSCCPRTRRPPCRRWSSVRG